MWEVGGKEGGCFMRLFVFGPDNGSWGQRGQFGGNGGNSEGGSIRKYQMHRSRFAKILNGGLVPLLESIDRVDTGQSLNGLNDKHHSI